MNVCRKDNRLDSWFPPEAEGGLLVRRQVLKPWEARRRASCVTSPDPQPCRTDLTCRQAHYTFSASPAGAHRPCKPAKTAGNRQTHRQNMSIRTSSAKGSGPRDVPGRTRAIAACAQDRCVARPAAEVSSWGLTVPYYGVGTEEMQATCAVRFVYVCRLRLRLFLCCAYTPHQGRGAQNREPRARQKRCRKPVETGSSSKGLGDGSGIWDLLPRARCRKSG